MKTETKQKTDETEFIDLLLKEERESEINSKSWTKVRLQNIQVYNSFITKSNPSIINEYEIICNKEKDFENAIQKENSSLGKLYNYSFKNENIFHLGSQKYIYEPCNLIVITISDLDNTITKKVPIIPKHNTSKRKILYNLNSSKYLQIRKSLLNSNYLIRYDNKPIENFTSVLQQKIKNILLKSTILITPIFLSFIIMIYLSTMNPLNIILLFSSIYISIKLYQLMNKYTQRKIFKSISSININDIPSDSEITENTIGNRNVKYTNAEINIYENGDVIIEYNNIQWKFTGSNGIPSDKSKNLYRQYGSEFEENKIPIKYYKYNPEIDDIENSNKYIDTQKQWILEPDINNIYSQNGY